MLKFENLAVVGQIIRSYDFYGNKEAFIEGKIIDKGWMPNGALGYTIEIIKDSIQEQFGREGDIGYVAFETSLEYDDRVELIDTDNDAEYELVSQMMKELNAEQNCMVNV